MFHIKGNASDIVSFGKMASSHISNISVNRYHFCWNIFLLLDFHYWLNWSELYNLLLQVSISYYVKIIPFIYTMFLLLNV